MGLYLFIWCPGLINVFRNLLADGPTKALSLNGTYEMLDKDLWETYEIDRALWIRTYLGFESTYMRNISDISNAETQVA